MENAKELKFLSTLFAIVFCTIAATAGLAVNNATPSYAAVDEPVFCDDDIYTGDDTYGQGDGNRVPASYNVYYDSVDITYVTINSAPSYKSDDSLYSNYCGTLAGMNVVAYYDRWCTNLIPNYEPGIMLANGNYFYYPDLMKPDVRNTFSSLYTLMKTGEVGGTTATNFKNGLNAYVNDAGYSLSYTSMYKNTTEVNLNALTSAINQGKVGVVMCNEYNYVSSIVNFSDESRVQVAKTTSTVGHMMMVYGYETYRYYKDGVNFQTDTFLRVSSSYASGAQGYMQLDSTVKISDALIMTIS